jgi:hypothetical protein
MRNPLRRLYGRGDLHFITFSCYRRRPFLGTPRARHRFVNRIDALGKEETCPANSPKQKRQPPHP